jgi:hypothetical protein
MGFFFHFVLYFDVMKKQEKQKISTNFFQLQSVCLATAKLMHNTFEITSGKMEMRNLELNFFLFINV